MQNDKGACKNVGAAELEFLSKQLYGSKRRERECGIAAGDQTCKHRNQKRRYESQPIIRIIEPEMLAGKIVKDRQKKLRQQNPECKSDEAVHQSLTPVLSEQLATLGAHNLAQPDLQRPTGGTTDGEGHEVNTGDQQNDERDTGKDIRMDWLANRR